MKGIIRIILSCALIGCGSAEAGVESSVGLITELSGTVWLHRNGEKLEASTGKSLFAEDILALTEGSRTSLLSFPGCEEWVFSGPDKIRLDTDIPPVSEVHPDMRPAGTFDICFDPGSFLSASHGRLGGIAVRSDIVGPQRLKAGDGNATTAELLTIVLFDLKRERPEKAKPYYEMLAERMPPGPILKTLSGYFE